MKCSWSFFDPKEMSNTSAGLGIDQPKKISWKASLNNFFGLYKCSSFFDFSKFAGHIHSEDLTKVLVSQTYWPSVAIQTLFSSMVTGSPMTKLQEPWSSRGTIPRLLTWRVWPNSWDTTTTRKILCPNVIVNHRTQQRMQFQRGELETR